MLHLFAHGEEIHVLVILVKIDSCIQISQLDQSARLRL